MIYSLLRIIHGVASGNFWPYPLPTGLLDKVVLQKGKEGFLCVNTACYEALYSTDWALWKHDFGFIYLSALTSQLRGLHSGLSSFSLKGLILFSKMYAIWWPAFYQSDASCWTQDLHELLSSRNRGMVLQGQILEIFSDMFVTLPTTTSKFVCYLYTSISSTAPGLIVCQFTWQIVQKLDKLH